jgi:fumarate reductase flavoprotein subunit
MSSVSERELFSSSHSLIVIGGGGAGLPAALAAAEHGLSDILVLEKRSIAGGNASRAWGLFAIESPVQKQALVADSKEEFFHEYMDWAQWKIDPRIIRAYLWKSGDTIQWLEKKGIQFDLPRYVPGKNPPVWHVPEGRGAHMMKVLAEKCAEMKVSISLNTTCKKILFDETGKFEGVTVEKEGKQFILKAKALIIATGGFGGNAELLKKYCSYYDEHVHCIGIPYSGDGWQMASSIGAASEGLGQLLIEWPHVHGDPGSILDSITREPYTVYVNKKGNRFIDETKSWHAFECPNAIIRQPEKAGYILFDDAMRRSIEESGVSLGRGNNREAVRRGIPGLGDQLKAISLTNPANFKMSNSWADIADWIGADPGQLQTSVDVYNSFADRGYDGEFCKDRRYLLPLRNPPYYAIKGELIFLHTLGGLKINERMQVLNQNDNPIPGLYAAGVDTGGWVPETYSDKFSGTAFGYSVNSGRIAGENAAQFIERL